MSTFSERQGLKQPLSLSPSEIPIELRNRIWNVVKDYVDKEFHGQIKRDIALQNIWDKFFKKDIDNLKSWTSCI